MIITTTLGEIEIELWSKECPKACRNFVQLCLEKFYDSTIFHRVVPNFVAQGGDPSGTGLGGESIYGEPFKVSISFINLWIVLSNQLKNWIYRMKFTQDCVLSGEDWLLQPIQEIMTMNLNSSSHWEPLLNYKTNIPFLGKSVETLCSTWCSLIILTFYFCRISNNIVLNHESLMLFLDLRD